MDIYHFAVFTIIFKLRLKSSNSKLFYTKSKQIFSNLEMRHVHFTAAPLDEQKSFLFWLPLPSIFFSQERDTLNAVRWIINRNALSSAHRYTRSLRQTTGMFPTPRRTAITPRPHRTTQREMVRTEQKKLRQIRQGKRVSQKVLFFPF